MITREDIQSVLSLASALDPRIPQASDVTVSAWVEAFSDYSFELEDMLKAAHLHYQESSDRLMPNHVVKHAKRERAIRFRKHWVDGIRECTLCDEEGWVLDPDDKYGWAVRCKHTLTQELPVKPGHPTSEGVPRTPEKIQASLDAYWHEVRTHSEQRTAARASEGRGRGYRPAATRPGPQDYDPDAWNR